MTISDNAHFTTVFFSWDSHSKMNYVHFENVFPRHKSVFAVKNGLFIGLPTATQALLVTLTLDSRRVLLNRLSKKKKKRKKKKKSQGKKNANWSKEQFSF